LVPKRVYVPKIPSAQGRERVGLKILSTRSTKAQGKIKGVKGGASAGQSLGKEIMLGRGQLDNGERIRGKKKIV